MSITRQEVRGDCPRFFLLKYKYFPSNCPKKNAPIKIGYVYNSNPMLEYILAAIINGTGK